MSISALMHPILIEGWAWMLFRLVAGFCMAGMIMVTESWLNESATNATRGKILSRVSGGGQQRGLCPDYRLCRLGGVVCEE